MRCFNGRCPPPAGKVRPGAAWEEEASGWHRGSHLQGYTASLTLPHSQCCTYTRPQPLDVQIILGEREDCVDSVILLKIPERYSDESSALHLSAFIHIILSLLPFLRVEK